MVDNIKNNFKGLKPEKLDSETALVKIKLLVSRYYEDIGRGYGSIRNIESELIEEIDEVLDNVDIDQKRVILEKFELDKMKGGF